MSYGSGRPSAVYERIGIRYDQIWPLERVYRSQTASTETERVRYHNPAKLMMPPLDNEDQ